VIDGGHMTPSRQGAVTAHSISSKISIAGVPMTQFSKYESHLDSGRKTPLRFAEQRWKIFSKGDFQKP
jgi:hypothetical protein